ncbi:MAG: sugar transferase [Chitinophagales bacterium]|nr:sugar transferase [Chitinophagales bacterium]
MLIRIFDVILSSLGIILLLPVFLIVSIIILLESPGGVFYIQERIGKGAIPFSLIKFRSMRTGSDTKGLLTVGMADNRITKVGLFIRKYKLDELPQLFNVFIGDMSLVGPRPEVKKYVDLYSSEQRKVLSMRPGMTDLASIVYSNENELLEKQANPEQYYIDEIMPRKIELNMEFINSPSLLKYFSLIFKTIIKII